MRSLFKTTGKKHHKVGTMKLHEYKFINLPTPCCIVVRPVRGNTAGAKGVRDGKGGNPAIKPRLGVFCRRKT